MQKRVPLVQWTFLLFFTGYRAPSLPGIYTDSTPLSSFTERKRESGTGWDGVNGRILRCKFHSTRPLLPFLSIFRSLFHSCRSPFSLCPTVQTDLPLPSQPFPPISFLLFPTSSFLYLRPPAPLFEIVSQESSLFLSLPLFQLRSFSLSLALSFPCHRASDGVITIASLGRTRFFAVRRDFYGAKEREKAPGRALERTCRGCGGRRSWQRS